MNDVLKQVYFAMRIRFLVKIYTIYLPKMTTEKDRYDILSI